MTLNDVRVIEWHTTDRESLSGRIHAQITRLQNEGWELVSVSPVPRGDFHLFVFLHFRKEDAYA